MTRIQVGLAWKLLNVSNKRVVSTLKFGNEESSVRMEPGPDSMSVHFDATLSLRPTEQPRQQLKLTVNGRSPRILLHGAPLRSAMRTNMQLAPLEFRSGTQK